jgi:hypothetical protein
MKNILIIILLAVISIPGFSQNKSTSPDPVQQVIRDVFKAFSNSSIQQMEQVVTEDVNILEHGTVWTLDSIKLYFKRPRPDDFKRLNDFEFFQTEVTEKMAFVSYFNTADFHANGKDRKVKWLESAVLVKEGQQWKVKMLHSTRMPTK